MMHIIHHLIILFIRYLISMPAIALAKKLMKYPTEDNVALLMNFPDDGLQSDHDDYEEYDELNRFTEISWGTESCKEFHRFTERKFQWMKQGD